MNSKDLKISRPRRSYGFTLVEMLVVIAIMSILMTAGAIGLSGAGGKGVTSGVAGAEALFDEARGMAVSKNLRTCVLVAKKNTNDPAQDLRRILVATEPVDPITGKPTAPNNPTPAWVLSSRGMLLPDQTFFSNELSKNDFSGSGAIPTVRLTGVKAAFAGEYYLYEFNDQGLASSSTDPNYEGGASFVLGSGARNSTKNADTAPPKITGSAKRDFGGFVVRRNGSTSLFRSPDQISNSLPGVGEKF